MCHLVGSREITCALFVTLSLSETLEAEEEAKKDTWIERYRQRRTDRKTPR